MEIDESIISKRKNNVGRILNEIWVFGGVCRETHERFVVRVPKRDTNTLIPIIQQMVLPGSTIHSDGWSVYNSVGTLPEGYTYKVVKCFRISYSNCEKNVEGSKAGKKTVRRNRENRHWWSHCRISLAWKQKWSQINSFRRSVHLLKFKNFIIAFLKVIFTVW